MHFVRNGEKLKMQKIDLCQVGLQLSDSVTRNLSEPDITPIMKYIMVGLIKLRHNNCVRGVIEYTLV